jgi:hypothetical protein
MRPCSAVLAALVGAGLLGLAQPSSARADLFISIDKNAQKMTVSVDGEQLYVWPVATGIARYDTPDGEFKPFRMERKHYSREWDDAPMPYSIFFTQQGHAIHGTNHKIDGAPHSHGCVRLSVAHAAQLWALVKEQKLANTRVELTGEIPTKKELMARRASGQSKTVDDDADRATGRQAAIAADQNADQDDDISDVPRVGHGWGIFREGGRTYYFRTGPGEVQRVYRRVYRLYRRYGRFPYW